jgi:probable HAF family extracellular repeat protein
MVGSSRNSAGYDNAFVVRNGVATDLGALSGGDAAINSNVNSRALGVNDSEQIVGYSMTSFGVYHATLWQNGAVTDLGGISNTELSEAVAVNKSGLIVGYAMNTSSIDEAVTWLNGTMTVLPDLQSNGHSLAYGVNDAGIVVGRSDIYINGVWQEHAALWQNGKLTDLNSLLPANSGWVLNYARAINNNGEIVGIGTLNGVSTAFALSIGDASGPSVSATAAIQGFATAPHSSPWNVSDSAANIITNLDSLENLAQVAKLLQVTFTDSTTPLLTVTDLKWSQDAGVIGVMAGGYNVHVMGVSVVHGQTRLYAPHVTAIGVTDSAVNVETSLSTLEGWAANGQLLGITLTDSNPTFILPETQLTAAQSVLSLVQGNYSLDVIGATAAQASLLASNSHLSAITIDDTAANIVASEQALQQLKATVSYVVADTAANIGANLDALEALHNGGASVQLGVTDITGSLKVTAAQLTSDFSILHNATGNFLVSIDASQPNLTINGLSGHGNVAVFQGNASQYTVAGVPGVSGAFTVTDVSTGRTSVDTLSGVIALQFKDGLDFVAAAPSASAITTGNVTELYSAVLARVPDASGLQFYQQYLAANPSTQSLTMAQWFLVSAEYTGNSAHNYAQSAAGDGQFITDTYQNLLHRAPDTGAVSFYTTNVINPMLTGLTPGTAAYASAELQAHAQVLVYFAASQEFLNDVQITAQHPADAQHWLLLV